VDAKEKADALARATAVLARSLELVADSVAPMEGGWILRTPSLPLVWNLNQLRIVDPVSPRFVLEQAEVHFTPLPFRHLVAEGDSLGRVLEQPLRREGYKLERELVMAMSAQPRWRTQTPCADVIEPDERGLMKLERRWLAEDERISDEVTDQVLDATRREGRALNEQRFGILDGEGQLAAMTKLRSDGGTAQVEDVFTAPESRGRGFASTLVAHAVMSAQERGAEVVFIVADDDDWPKHLYARLGFVPVGRKWTFHKALG
jgi:ribosomal protein S18 acetylase RimI-like enzyme